jgi:hypothetical protein
MANSTPGVGIEPCPNNRYQNRFARPLDHQVGAPTGERQAFFVLGKKSVSAVSVAGNKTELTPISPSSETELTPISPSETELTPISP